MPPRPHDPTKPTFYLDQSTLSEAFRADADPAYAPLKGWVERVAREANLCLSNAHILELSRMPQSHIAQAEGMAAWIDSMPTVWMRPLRLVGPEEDEFWTKVAAGITAPRQVEVFTDDLAETYGTFTEAEKRVIEGEGRGSICPLLRRCRSYGEEDLRTQMLALLAEIQGELRAVSGFSKKAKQEGLRARRRLSLSQVAVDALIRIKARGDPDWQRIPRSIIDDLPELFEQGVALPSLRVRLALGAKLTERADALTSGGKGERNILSDFGDYEHASVAAAYCDIFNCDSRNERVLHPVRARIKNLKNPVTLSARGGAAKFVSTLMATWP